VAVGAGRCRNTGRAPSRAKTTPSRKVADGEERLCRHPGRAARRVACVLEQLRLSSEPFPTSPYAADRRVVRQRLPRRPGRPAAGSPRSLGGESAAR
jgi:hypothetical protein